MNKVNTILMSVLSIVLIHASGEAQFAKGKNYLGAHLGLSGVGSTISFGADYERGITDKIGPGYIGLGGTIDYWSYDFNYLLVGSGFSYKYVALGVTGNYHLIVGDPKWDPFGGLVLGYYIVSVSTPAGTYTGGFDGSRLFLGLDLGVRYAISPQVDLQARLGFGPYILAVGADYKF
jgi:hypothetical protein